MLGRSVRAAAGNPDLARLSGISPRMRSTLVWALRRLRGHRLDDPHRRLPGRRRPASRTSGRTRCCGPSIAAVIARLTLVPHRARRRPRHRGGRGAHPVQLPRPARPDRRPAAPRGPGRGAGSSPGSGGEGESAFSFTPPVETIPARLKAQFWVRNLDRVVLLVFAGRRRRHPARSSRSRPGCCSTPPSPPSPSARCRSPC